MSPNSVRSIVVVDDSTHDYETYVRILKRSPRKYNTKYMSLGKEFLASLSEWPDCVLLDLSLPDTNGLEIIKTLKQKYAGSVPFPIVMVTGSGDETTGEQAVALGAQDYLVKEDVTPNSLRRSIEFAITRFRLEQRLRESEAKHRALAASLKASEERFRAIFEHAQTGIVIAKQQGSLIQFNPSFAEMLGYSTEELQGKNFAELIHPEDREANLLEVRRLEAGEIPFFEVENRYLHKNGKPVYAHKFVSILDDHSAGPPLVMALVTDITERKRAEERLEKRGRQLALLARTSQSLMTNQDVPEEILKQIFVELSELIDAEIFFHYRLDHESGMLKLTHFAGFPEKEMESFETLRAGDLLCGRVAETRTRTVIQEMHVSNQPGCEALIAAGAKSYIGFPLLANRDLLGTLSFASRRRTHFEQGEIDTVQSVCDQIATTLERSRLMVKLQKSEQRFRLFIENAPAAIAMFDREMRFLSVSDRFLHDYGIGRDAIGRSYYEVFPEASDRWRQIHNRALVGEVLTADEDWALGQGGREQYLKWEIRPWYDGQDIGGILLCTEDISERVRAENAVRESEKRLSLVVTSADVGTWDWDLRKNQLVWSDRCKQLFGLPDSTEMSYDTFLQAVHPDDRDSVARRVDIALHDKADCKVEMRAIWPDRSLHWIAFRGRATHDASGMPARMSGVAFDVTQTKLAEEALRSSEERNRLLAGQMNQAAIAAELGFWSWDIESGDISPDRNNRMMLGLPLEGPSTFADFVSKIHAQDRVDLQREIENSIKTGAPYDAEFRVSTDGYSVRWIGARGAVVLDSAGKITGMRGMAIDITRRKELAENLRQSEARLRLALDAAQMSVWSWNLRADTIAWSKNLEPQMAMVPGSFKGTFQSFLDLVHPEDRDRVITAIEHSITHGDEYRIEFRMIKADGGTRWTETRGMVRRDENGVPLEFFGVDVDITERKKIEQEIYDLNKNLESLVEKRTKELAETLGNLQTEVATRKAAEESLSELSARLLRTQDDEQRRIARELHDSTGQTLAALKMEIARVQGEIERQAVDGKSLDASNSLADQAIAEIRTISHLLHPPLLDEVGFTSAAKWYVEGFEKRSGIKVALQLPEIQLSRSASLALFRVLQESLTNVLRHSGASAVEVRLTKHRDEAVLSVKDSGKGIPSEQIATFMQTGGGVGIGLAGMGERLKQLGGDLDLKSERRGTNVIARLPMHSSETPAEKTLSAS